MARTYPYRPTPNTTADADQVAADFDAIVGFFGDLRDADFSAAADLDGNKLSQTAGKRVPESRLENNAASDRVVASDAASPGNDALRAISGNHVKTWTIAQVARIIPATSITGAMLAVGAAVANLAAASLGLDKLKVTVHTVAFGPTVVISGVPVDVAVNPSVAFPKATYELVAMYAKNLSGGAATWRRAVPRPNDTGANWAGSLTIEMDASANMSGTAVYVFISKV